MNRQANVREFKRLEHEIADDEADIEAKRWRQAELAAAAVADGMSRSEYGRQVGKANSTISEFVRVWERWGSRRAVSRPRFPDAWTTIRTGSEEIVTRAEETQRQKERQMPTRHVDKVEMAEKLLAEPRVVKAILAKPTVASRGIANAVIEKETKAKAKAAAQARERAEAKKEHLPGIAARASAIVTRVDQWAIELDGIHQDIGQIKGRSAELVDMALNNLIRAAEDLRLELGHASKLRVIEGSKRKKQIA